MLEEIRLTKEEIKATHPYWNNLSDDAVKRVMIVANAATDKAIKGILNHMNSRDVGGVNPEWAISNTFHQDLNYSLGKDVKAGTVGGNEVESDITL